MCCPDVNVQEQDTSSTSTTPGTSLYHILNMFILLLMYLDFYSLSFKPSSLYTNQFYHYVFPQFEHPSSLTGNSFHISDGLSGLFLIFFNSYVVVFNVV